MMDIKSLRKKVSEGMASEAEILLLAEENDKLMSTLTEKVRNHTATEDEILELAELIDDVSAGHIASVAYETNSKGDIQEITNISKMLLYKGRMLEGIYARSVRRRIGWIASAAVVLIAAGIFVYSWQARDTGPKEIFASIEPKVLQGKNHFRLEDGTTVELNNGSELSYEFNGTERLARLKGEGFFKVAHDPRHPFKVISGDVTTTVLGTVFHITAYPDQKDITVAVIDGKVAVGSDDRAFGTFTRQQQVVFHKLDKSIEKSQTPSTLTTEWRNDILVFDGIALEDAIMKVADQFDLKADVRECRANQCRLDMSLVDRKNANEVLQIIAKVMGIQYQIKDNTIIVSGGEPCTPSSTSP